MGYRVSKTDCRRRILSGILAAVFVLVCAAQFLPTRAAAASSAALDALKEKASTLAQSEAALESQLASLANQEAAKLEEKALLEQQISVISAQIVTTQAVIEEYDVLIALKQEELDEAQAQAEEYYAIFCARVRVMEEQGSINY